MSSALSSSTGEETALIMGINVDSRTLVAFGDSFRQVKLNVRTIRMQTERDLDNTHFDACIINLDDWAPTLLARIRRSALNSSALVYGIGPLKKVGAVKEFGISAVLENATAEEIREAVELTHLLLVHRFRRFVRLPVVTPVQISSGQQTCTGFTIDVSTGGMALATTESLPKTVALNFTLPNTKDIQLRGIVCWRSPKKVGVQFIETPDLGHIVTWADRYLGIR